MAKRSSLGPLMLSLVAASCTVYIACGDDEIILPPDMTGGSGGTGAGQAGMAGMAGTGGDSGSGGTAGAAGSAGSAGDAGSGGSVPDAGPDAGDFFDDDAGLDDAGTSNAG